ncbi:MAG: hypothetical protein AABY86_01105, partial [Bdellovibrionota bacterium]
HEFLNLKVSLNLEFNRIILHALKSFPANFSISDLLLSYLEQHLADTADDEIKLLCIEAMCYVPNEKIARQIDRGLPAEKNVAIIHEILKTLSYAIKKEPAMARSVLYCWEHKTFIESFTHDLSQQLVKHILEMVSASPNQTGLVPNFHPFFLWHEIEISQTLQILLAQQFSPELLHSILCCVKQKLICMNVMLIDYLKYLDFNDIPYTTALLILDEMALSPSQDLKRRAMSEYWTLAHDPLNVQVSFRDLMNKALVQHE